MKPRRISRGGPLRNFDRRGDSQTVVARVRDPNVGRERTPRPVGIGRKAEGVIGVGGRRRGVSGPAHDRGAVSPPAENARGDPLPLQPLGRDAPNRRGAVVEELLERVDMLLDPQDAADGAVTDEVLPWARRDRSNPIVRIRIAERNSRKSTGAEPSPPQSIGGLVMPSRKPKWSTPSAGTRPRIAPPAKPTSQYGAEPFRISVS